MVTGMDPAGVARVVDLGFRSGAAADLAPGRIVVAEAAAADLDVVVGDDLTVTFPETGERQFEVAGTFARGSLLNASYVITLADYEANVTSRLDAALLLRTEPGVDPERARADVEAALAPFPGAEVLTPAEVTRKAQDSVDQLLGIVTALLLLAVVIAVLGIVNTLSLSVVERTRELGLLRAVGATRSQVRALVRRESVLMALLGAATGIALGTGAGIALARALVDEGVTAVTIPSGRLVVYAAVAVVVGILAAVGPARRAARVDVLAAVSTE